jgi:pimeloyl-ACP methyl ester carboxylesterase
VRPVGDLPQPRRLTAQARADDLDDAVAFGVGSAAGEGSVGDGRRMAFLHGLFHIAVGAGTPLLLVHGWGADSHSWSAHLPALAGRHRVVAPDLRGHGRSSVTATGYRMPELAADLAALLRATGTGPVIAVGHSMGGQAVTVLAVEHPDLVSGLVVLDPAYGAVGDEVAGQAADRAALWARGGEAAARQLADAYTEQTPAWLAVSTRRLLLGTPAHVLAAAYEGMYTVPDAIGNRDATEKYLARVRQPSLAIFASRSRAGWYRALPAHPLSDVECWPGAGHYLHQEQPARFAATLERWRAAALKARVSTAPPELPIV